jgi:hypothetical protein
LNESGHRPSVLTRAPARACRPLGGASGSFSANLPGSGTYYLVLAHGTGFEYSGQAVRVSYRVTGIQPEFLGIGLPFVAAGIVGVAFGLRARARRRVSSVRAAELSR